MSLDVRNTALGSARGWLVGLAVAGCLFAAAEEVLAQDQAVAVHRRGHLWESLWNYGMIGDLGAWDYLTPRPIGMYPGFTGFVHPTGGEFNAVNTFANANMHNFRSGIWIGARNVMIPGPPPDFQPTPKPHEVYLSNVQQGLWGMAWGELPGMQLRTNYVESLDHNPMLPEEWTESSWNTNLGITVTRRSYVWGYPGFRDFIIYDYTFENTGNIVSTLVSETVPNPEAFQQTLQDVYFAVHSGISVSTKSQINFHCDLNAVQAGGFGWEPASYHDYYYLSDDNSLAFSYNFNGGAEPTPWDPYCIKDNNAWQQRFGPELQSPAGFGWLSLHADPAAGGSSSVGPHVLRIDSHKGGTFQGQDLDFEFFTRATRGEQGFYELMSTPGLQPGLGNDGNRMNFFTLSYGPYTMAPGQQVRIVVAEIAGVMDYADVVAGDPDGLFPQATIEAVQANAENARRAVQWGMGASVDGMPLAAHVPPPPPAPDTDAVNASIGTEIASIGVTWDDVAEVTSLTDGSGAVFYDGSQDLSGYRVYRTQDFQFTSDAEPPALRGAYWNLIADIPIADVGQYFDPEIERYRYVDEDVEFGRRYGYYVAAYSSSPRAWTSANGTVVDDLPELVSGDYNRSAPTNAVAGPVESFDVYAIPNPYVFGDSQRSFGSTGTLGERTIEFRNLPERATIRLYTIAGDLIRTLTHGPDSRGNLSGTIAWDQKSESGLIVAPGLYIFHVTSDTEGVDGRLTGKLMIIR